MGFKGTKAQKKQVYDKRVNELLEEYSKALICTADNVGSKQMQDIRSGLRPDSIVLMGKNTLLKRSIRMFCERTGNESWNTLLPLLVGNVGIVFTKGDLKEVREEIAKYKVGAPARVGLVAPIDVIVPPGNTGLDPSQTSFFQVHIHPPFTSLLSDRQGCEYSSLKVWLMNAAGVMFPWM